MWALPDVPVYVDGRTDLYGDTFLSEYIDVYTDNTDWAIVFAVYGVNTAVIGADSPLSDALAADPGWVLDYEDDQAVVYVREGVQ
jgi:hypothetical protein